MKGKKGFTLIELLVVIAIIAILAAILFPVFAKARETAKASQCVSNLKNIGSAIKMYLPDWDNTFPTNRNLSNNITQHVKLSQPPPTSSLTAKPTVFQYGVNWVEALYNYMEQVSDTKDPASAWRCPKAQEISYRIPLDRDPDTNSVNYSFNSNLIEEPEGAINFADKLMMVREVDRKVGAFFEALVFYNRNKRQIKW